MSQRDPSAYIQGLTLLARRELSEAQVRQRLSRRGYEAAAIDAAIARLKEERAIDDSRVAGAIARVQSGYKGRGRQRVLRQIEVAGIAGAVARRAVDEVFSTVSEDNLLAAALDKRLRGREEIDDDNEFQRVYRHLVRQGFETDRVLKVLAVRRRSR